MTAPNGLDHDTLRAIAERFPPYRVEGQGYKCTCPCHPDHDPSLEIKMGDKGAPIAICRAGCDQAKVWAAVRPPREPRTSARRIVAVYPYPDEQGVVLYEVVRFDPKDFRQRLPDGTWKLGDTRRVLYRLPEILAADEVVIVEGEKAADRLAALGVAATCSPGGAGKWRKAYSPTLAGKAVLILPDNDDPGRKHGRDVAASLAGIAKSVRVLELPGLPDKGDVADWLEAGHTLEELIARARHARAHEKTADPGLETEPRASRARASREGWTAELRRRGKNDECERNDFNILLALRQAPELRGRVRLNTFSENVEAADLPWCKGRDWGPWDETDDNLLAEWLQGNDLDVRPGQCGGNVAAVARANPFHPVREHLDGLAWDGVERLSSWLVTYLGAKDAPSEYLEAVGRAWLISAIARVMRPGCQADHILILEGPQGGKKSSALRTLVGNDDWFTDEVATLGTKDYAQDLRGKLVIELSELSAMGRAEIERVKAAASRRVDHYRPSYGRYSKDFPRQCVLAGTTNSASYLLDDTGNRRFWCVMTGAIDLDALARARPQLWAEAYHAYKAGERWHLEPELEKAAAAEQAKRREEEPWTQEVLAYAVGLEKVYIADVLKGSSLNIQDASRRDKPSAKRVAAILRSNGYAKRHGEKGNFWTLVQPEPTPPTVQPLGSGKNPSVSTTLNPLNPLNHTNDTYTHAHTSARDARWPARPYRSREMGSDGSVGSNPLETKANTLTPTVQPEPKPTVQPPWAADCAAWDGRCGADPDCIKEWVALAGGACSRRAVTLPASCREHPAALKRLLSHITLQAWKVDWT